MEFRAVNWRQHVAQGTEGEYLERIIGPKWDDLRFPASAINPPGAVSDPDLDATDGTWLFDAAGTEILFFQAQLPHGWESGTELRPHVHWVKTTSAAGAVLWKLRHRWASPGKTFTDWSALDSGTLAVSDADTAFHHAMTVFSPITIRGGASTMLLIELSRVGGDAADTYAADAKLLEFDLHFYAGTAGTTEEFSN